MKQVILALAIWTVSTAAFAQKESEEDETKGKFRRDNIFLGGSLGLGIGGWNGGFNIGANPEVGYSITNWLDAGVVGNFNYFSYRAEFNNGFRQRSTTLGGGVFARVHPIRNFFIQVLPEYNTINTTLTNMNQTPYTEFKIKEQAPSFLAGVGYGQHLVGASSFFTVVMFDLGNNPQSPYLDSYGAKLPILRTGFNVYLRPKSQR